MKDTTTNHGRGGHDITVDADTGIMFCRTCGHHVLTDEQKAASQTLAALKRLKDQMTNLLLICEVPSRFAKSFNDGQNQARAAIAQAEPK